MTNHEQCPIYQLINHIVPNDVKVVNENAGYLYILLMKGIVCSVASSPEAIVNVVKSLEAQGAPIEVIESTLALLSDCPCCCLEMRVVDKEGLQVLLKAMSSEAGSC